jgi:hypothetical protein
MDLHACLPESLRGAATTIESIAVGRLLAAHDGAPVDALPARFAYDRRMVAAMCGAVFLHLARQSGHDGGGLPLSLADFYARLRTGAVSPQTPAGRWLFGLALLGESLAL